MDFKLIEFDLQPMGGPGFNYPGANVPGVPGLPGMQMPEGMTPLQQQIWMKAFGGGIPGVTGKGSLFLWLLAVCGSWNFQ